MTHRPAADSAPTDRTDESPETTTGQWLVTLCGLPGVGKSTVAGCATSQLDAVRLRTDIVRKELFGEPEYTEPETDAVYRELGGRAGDCLASGESVVLDATFAREKHRQLARTLADDHDVRFKLVRVVCDRSVVRRRITDREGVSDADIEVYRLFKEKFEPVEIDHAVVDNSGERAATRTQVQRLFRGVGSQ